MSNQTKGFVVFEDLDRATGPKVHAATCEYYQRWIVHHTTTTTTTWHGPFDTLEEAKSRCEHIAAVTRLKSSVHNCVS
ncbi:MAG: hypothetical protein ABSB26_09410 [Nitrososphaerales archaeon]